MSAERAVIVEKIAPRKIIPVWILQFRAFWRETTTEDLREELELARFTREGLCLTSTHPYEVETAIDEISKILAERLGPQPKPP